MSWARLVWEVFKDNFSWAAAIDIVLVALAVYYLLVLVKGTRAVQLVKGIVVLVALIFATQALELKTVHWLLSRALLPGVIALVILFQPELRLALEQIGRGKFWSPSLTTLHQETITQVVNQIARAVKQLSQNRTGALIAIEQRVGLNDVAQTGRAIRGMVSSDLLRTIFLPGGPLHDGAVVIRGDQIVAAGCLLPLTERDDVSTTLGTRHRAALGLSEQSDALVIVVSEETGAVSLSQQGELVTNISDESLRERLLAIFRPQKRESHLWFRRKTDVASKPRP